MNAQTEASPSPSPCSCRDSENSVRWCPPAGYQLGFAPASLAALGASVLFVMAYLRTGWLSDDSFIAIRSVDNLVNGFGFVLNVGERVQSFTSPLWAILNIPLFLVTQDPYVCLMVAGVLTSLGLVAVVWSSFRHNRWHVAAALLALTASTSFLHFSTSGLENPLAHVLIALFIAERISNGRTLTRSGVLVASALFLTRFDYVILVAPPLLLALIRYPRASLRAAVPGLLLAGSWLTFATFYYGFPLPNTAYAKLNTGVPLSEQMLQGVTYLVDSVYKDPIVLITIALTGALLLARHTPASWRAVYLGVLSYLLYVVCIGGDFMSGRFLTTTYVASVLLLVRAIGLVHAWALPLGSALAFWLALPCLADRRSDPPTECFVPMTGVVDERACYVEHTGLSQNIRLRKWKTHIYLKQFEQAAAMTPGHVMAYDLVGMVSYANRQRKHVVERMGLTEPLLARLRTHYDGGWRVGHFPREIPVGYLETLSSGKNVIADPCVRRLHDELSPVVRGPLWSLQRFASIWRLNVGSGICPAP